MKKVFLISAFCTLLFAGCSSNDDDKTGSSDWNEIVTFMVNQGEIKCYEENIEEEEDKGILDDALITFKAVDDFIVLYVDDRVETMTEPDWIKVVAFDKESVSGKIGNLTFETKVQFENFYTICKATFKSKSDFKIVETSYYDDDSIFITTYSNK